MSVQSGTRLGRYEIVAPLGAGGMGEVYGLAESSNLVKPHTKSELQGRREWPEKQSYDLPSFQLNSVGKLDAIVPIS